MCLAVYLASVRSLSQVEETAFLVRTIGGRESEVRKHFAKPYVHYVGSYTGCGCGFLADDPSTASKRANSVAGLLAYLDREIPDSDFELFVCWEGSQAKSPTVHLRLARRELEADTDWCKELVFSSVGRAA